MKIDIHTHVMLEKKHMSPAVRASTDSLWGEGSMDCPCEWHWEKTARETDRTVVFGSRFQAAGMMVDDEYVANYVAQHPETLIGFMSIDPTLDGANEIERKCHDLNLKGIKTSPFYCNCALDDPRFEIIFSTAERLGLPIMLHQGPAFPQTCFTKYADPKPLEEIALRHPKLNIIIAHMGYPWEYEILHIVRRYPNLFVDISAMIQQPWDFYNKLIMYHEWHCLDHVLLGSDFPFGTWKETYNGLMNVNYMAEGTHLPQIPEKDLLRIAERDTIDLLGIDT